MSLNHVPKGIRNEDYNNWRRFGKKRDSEPRGRFARQHGAEEAAQARSGDGILHETGAVPDWYSRPDEKCPRHNISPISSR